jgi:hypothetical protein
MTDLSAVIVADDTLMVDQGSISPFLFPKYSDRVPQLVFY